ncbi:MAG: hypothetical protein DWQ37_03450 [Planctomycetota bacterium]|nr:MAG: hypothetical protein DWQ37_03450 [Planctomycetota bacterium]
MATAMEQAFGAIGARVIEETFGGVFEIGLQEIAGQETYQLKYPWSDEFDIETPDVRPKHRHLVLDVSSRRFDTIGRYLCGHDERHWFVATLPIEERTKSVRGAMEALKPEIVRRAQKRRGVKHRLHRRRTEAYVRQGEWFFLPRPMMHVGEKAVAGGELVRPGGKPHLAEWIYRPNANETFVRGAVSHPDHATLYLQVWHRVVLNNEARVASERHVARRVDSLARMTYLD